jgi:hypothetical protein
MYDIKDYLLEYKRKVPNILLLWGGLLVFIITITLIINNFLKFTDYYQVEGMVQDNKLIITMPYNKVNSIINNKYVYIQNEKYKYKIENIKKDIINVGNEFYQELMIKIEFKDRKLIDNNVIEIKFIIKEMTIFEYIYNLFKGA